MNMKKLNCMGDYCPIPLLRLQEEMKTFQPSDQLVLVTDHSCVVESIHEYLSSRKFIYHTDEIINGVWEITIMKQR